MGGSPAFVIKQLLRSRFQLISLFLSHFPALGKPIKCPDNTEIEIIRVKTSRNE